MTRAKSWGSKPRVRDVCVLSTTLALLVSCQTASRTPAQSSRALDLRACSTLDLATLRRNIEATFESKFAKVTADPKAESAKNIARIQKLMVQRSRTNPALEKKAQALAQQILSRIEIIHETRKVESAIAILRSGEFLSSDELYRRKILDLENRGGTITNFNTDGHIGEQDVIFFSMTTPIVRRSGFGPVKFRLKRRAALEKGYYTPYAFGMGSIWTNETRIWQDCLEDQSSTSVNRSEIYEKNVSNYRQRVFVGEPHLLNFLELSSIEALWTERVLGQPRISQKVESIAKRSTEREQECKKLPSCRDQGSCDYNPTDTASVRKAFAQDDCLDQLTRTQDFKFIFDALGQSLPTSMPEFYTAQESARLIDRVRGKAGTLQSEDGRVLSAFATMPDDFQGLSLLSAPLFGFWEFKVPRALSLDYVEAIELSASMAPNERGQVLTAVREYSARSGRMIAERVSGGATIIDFK